MFCAFSQSRTHSINPRFDSRLVVSKPIRRSIIASVSGFTWLASAVMRRSIDARARAFDGLRPFRDFRPDERGEALRRGLHWLRPDDEEALFELGGLGDF